MQSCLQSYQPNGLPIKRKQILLQQQSNLLKPQWDRRPTSAISQIHHLRSISRNVSAGDPPSGSAGQQANDDSSSQNKGGGVLGSIKRFFFPEKMSKQRMAELGLGFTAAYGLLSNLVYATGMAVSWIIFVRRYSKTPLFPGEWKAFLLFYAGFWTINNFIRPIRVAACVSLAPVANNIFQIFQDKFNVSRRTVFIWYIILLGVVTWALFIGGIFAFAGPHAFDRTPWT